MASTGNSNPYTFQRASTVATRSLISDTKPSEIPSTSSNDVKGHAKETLQSKTTNHYEQAAAEAIKADHIPATTASSAAVSVSDRPSAKRQQSWKMSVVNTDCQVKSMLTCVTRTDFKGQQQGQMLADITAASGECGP